MRLLLVFVLAVTVLAQAPPLQSDPPIACGDCGEWNLPREPRRVFGNTYSVGVAGLSSILIASDEGLVLLDGALPQSAPLIDANIRKLGFRTEAIRLILNSHAHYDHAGGIGAFQRASGAIVAASPEGARALERGEPVPQDPQAAFGASNRFPAVHNVRVVKDGEVLRVGGIEVTAHLTPGHTPGSTTWSWRACEGSRCQQVVYADSLNAVSAPGFRFSGDRTHTDLVPSFRRSIETVAALPCDILLTVHPSFAERNTCRTYAADAMKRLEQRVSEERTRPPSPFGLRRDRLRVSTDSPA
jgi:metallo-beta-lactamase class B